MDSESRPRYVAPDTATDPHRPNWAHGLQERAAPKEARPCC